MSPRPDIIIRDGQVYTPRFDDIYFSRDDGPAESEHVFLRGNALPERWRGQADHVIAETGFGTGLNFLVTLRAWLQDPARCNRLDYYSIEAYPLTREQLSEVYAAWPDFKALSEQLVAQYPSPDTGVHTLLFAEGRVQLHLLFMEIGTALNELQLRPHSWFLDGFAPSRNPEMWRPQHLQRIAAATPAGSSLATFTATGEVRRGLEAAGFRVQKRRGYGRKREMITAIRTGAEQACDEISAAPWFALPKPGHRPEQVAVIGAGIAGAQIAWHLARRGIKVTILESESEIARGASGNPAGILAPRITAAPSAGEAFYLAAFLYQLRQLQLLEAQGANIDYATDGLLQLPVSSDPAGWTAKLAARNDLPAECRKLLTADEVSKRLGEPVHQGGVLIETACALSPRSLCQALITQAGVELRLGSAVSQIERDGRYYQLKLDGDARLEADTVVLANGHRATEYCSHLPMTPVRGQTSLANLDRGNHPPCAVDHAAYLVHTPGNPRQVVIGASYRRGDTGTDLRQQESDECVHRLSEGLPGLAARLARSSPAHAGIRATTSDRWPLVGPCWDNDYYLREYADLHQGRQFKHYPDGRYVDGLYVLSGLGSRGLASAGYCANLLSHMMLGSTPPAERHLLGRLHPARFVVRQLRKKN